MENIITCSTLVAKDGTAVPVVDLQKAKAIGLYFSAHWCPPCRQFTPVLDSFYNEVKEAHNGELEIVFVSSDRSDASFDEYFGMMPWLAVPFSENELRASLKSRFEVTGIPTLVILKPDGTVVTKDGRKGVSQGPDSFSKWL